MLRPMFPMDAPVVVQARFDNSYRHRLEAAIPGMMHHFHARADDGKFDAVAGTFDLTVCAIDALGRRVDHLLPPRWVHDGTHCDKGPAFPRGKTKALLDVLQDNVAVLLVCPSLNAALIMAQSAFRETDWGPAWSRVNHGRTRRNRMGAYECIELLGSRAFYKHRTCN